MYSSEVSKSYDLRSAQICQDNICVERFACRANIAENARMTDTYASIGQIVRKLRKERKLTLQQLADQIDDYDAGNLSRFERGEQGVQSDKLKQIASALGTSVSKIHGLFEDPSEPLFDEAEQASMGVMEKSAPYYTHAGKVPLISWVTAGSWEDPIDNYHVGDAEEWLPCPPNCQENTTFALTVTGESMDDGGPNGYRDGEMIFVDGSKAEPQHNADVIVKNGGGKVTFKRLINSNGDWFLKPLNPNWPDKTIPLDSEATIVGRVMFSGRMR